MNRFILTLVIFISIIPEILYAQDRETYQYFLRFTEAFNSGNFVKAEEALLSVIKSNNPPEEYLVAAYNNLGQVNYYLGKFDESLDYYNLAEAGISNKQNSTALADIYINKSIIFLIQKSYKTAIEHLDKGLTIYQKIVLPDKTLLQRISTAYMNLGIVNYTIKDYKSAFENLEKSSHLKIRYDLDEKELLFLNLAKVYSATDEPGKAEFFFQKSIAQYGKSYSDKYHRLLDMYFDYGLFLESQNRYSEGLKVYRKALSVCRGYYGEKHTFTSLSYNHLADCFLKQGRSDSAIIYFQKSLISVVRDFNNSNILSNPRIDSATFNIRLCENLKSKSRTLELLASKQNSVDSIKIFFQKSLETIELALDLIDRIRINYLDQESKMYLAENEKETYLFAVHIAGNLYKLTNDKSYKFTMFNIAQKSKAAVLRNEISENELVYSFGMPDSVRRRQNYLSVNISAYNKLINQELGKKDIDTKKISLWKDEVFAMTRENESIKEFITINYPQFNNLLSKAETISLRDIQNRLPEDQTIIEYLLSSMDIDGKRRMYVFLISKESFEVLESNLDSLFLKNVDNIRSYNLPNQLHANSVKLFSDYTSALNYMYCYLFQPVEELIKNNRIIVFPDEEISQLPFEAFLRRKPTNNSNDYEGLQYLIHKYAFSFGYSASLNFAKESKHKSVNKVNVFSPDYREKYGTESLPGTSIETDGIMQLFKGKSYTGIEATESNFKKAIASPAILHLALHSLSDTSDSKYSYLLFESQNDTLNDGRLYNYEIGIDKIQSPMVVLSVCNSGTGTNYNGEGIMSLARNFVLAGASSVIMTQWAVNDEASASIIKTFYYHLSKGKPKDVSMRLAKLEYVKMHPPIYSNPYFWAAFEVLGDNSPIKSRYRQLVPLTIILLIFSGGLLIYFKRRNIFLARSLK